MLGHTAVQDVYKRQGVDQQGFCELDVDAHELAGQSLDMGSRCDAAYGRELLLFLLSALYDSLWGQ